MFLLRLGSLATKSVFLIKFACANLALKTCAENLFNLWSNNVFVMVMISKFCLKFTNFCVVICFLNHATNIRYFIDLQLQLMLILLLNYLTSRILFSNSVSFAFLTRSITSEILFYNFVLSVSYLIFKTYPLMSILFTLVTKLLLLTLAVTTLVTAFLTTLFTASFKLLKSAGTGVNLSMSSSSTSVFKLTKFVFRAKCYFFKISFCCIIRQINFNIKVSSKTSKWFRKVLTHFYTMSFLSIQPLNELSYPFHLTNNLSPFLLITFSILNSFLLAFCNSFS